jgi:hypothetical protein
MALTAEQIADQIRDLGKDLPQTLGVVIQAAADQAIEDMKNRMSFKHNSSDGVRATIFSTFDESTMTLGITMPAHGYFQNFGVGSFEGKGKNGNQMPIDELTAEAFGASPNTTMSFGTGNYDKGGRPWGAYYSGLNAQDFMQLDLFVEQVADYVNQNLEL